MVLLTSLPSQCQVCGCGHYNAFGNPELCTDSHNVQELGVTESGLLVYTHRPGCHLLNIILQKGGWALCRYHLQPHTVLLPGILHEKSEPSGKLKWFCSPHSDFSSGNFLVLSWPQISVKTTPTHSPNLRGSFEAFHWEGPLNARKIISFLLRTKPAKDS